MSDEIKVVKVTRRKEMKDFLRLPQKWQAYRSAHFRDALHVP